MFNNNHDFPKLKTSLHFCFYLDPYHNATPIFKLNSFKSRICKKLTLLFPQNTQHEISTIKERTKELIIIIHSPTPSPNVRLPSRLSKKF